MAVDVSKTVCVSHSGLAHVLWLGGATGAGKSTLAPLLAATLDAHVYSTDAAIADHSAHPGPNAPLIAELLSMGMDDRWLRRDATTMLDTFPWFAGERFERVVADLERRPGGARVLAEGFRLLPRLVAPLLAQRRQAAWLTTTPELRRRAFARRPEGEQFWRRTSDPERAFERLLERDALFADAVVGQARGLGLKVVVVDGSRSVQSLADELADWFAG